MRAGGRRNDAVPCAPATSATTDARSCASPCSYTNAPRGAGSPGPSPVTARCPRFPTKSGC
ncbi:hypothetical protein E4K73_43950 [Streptomyces sp. IB201691-2A2]|nr:hypothetical protein E4K73_43950 [Streptomyces sp. IB201691-2A2]